MREIKFRFVDDMENVYNPISLELLIERIEYCAKHHNAPVVEETNGDYLQLNELKTLLATGNGKFEQYVSECMSVQAPPQFALDEGMVVEEHTGLKDSDGKEIYEGDILDVKDGITESPSIVAYKDGCFVLNNRFYTLGFVVKEGYRIHVVGNIHENPELVEEEE